jgi:hypothetical protein
VSLTRLKLRHRRDLASNNTSVPSSYIASVPLAGLSMAALALAAVLGEPMLAGVGALAAAGVATLNRGFLVALAQSEGWVRTVGALPLLWLELLVVGAGTGIGLLSYPFGRRY